MRCHSAHAPLQPSAPSRCRRGCAAAAALGGCAVAAVATAPLGVITPYRVEVVQGNVVTKEQVGAAQARHEPRQQVRDVLGSPLLTDVFHADRWDYVFTIRRQGVEPQLRQRRSCSSRATCWSASKATPMPSEARVRRHARHVASASGKAPPLELTDEQLQAALPAPAEAAARRRRRRSRRPPARSYPPLEPRRWTPNGDADRSAASLRRIAVAGASGRMGRMLIEAVRGAPATAAWPARSTSPAARRSAGCRRVPRPRQRRADHGRPARRAWPDAQVLIDFTRPEGTLAHLALCRELGVQAVIGTTGFSDGAEGRDRATPPATSRS